MLKKEHDQQRKALTKVVKTSEERLDVQEKARRSEAEEGANQSPVREARLDIR